MWAPPSTGHTNDNTDLHTTAIRLAYTETDQISAPTFVLLQNSVVAECYSHEARSCCIATACELVSFAAASAAHAMISS